MVHPGSVIAVSECRLYKLSYSQLEAIEEEHSLVVLRLYKLLSLLMAKRQEITIGHLATLVRNAEIPSA